MKKFMILYMAPVSAEVQMNVGPEEMNKKWNRGMFGTKNAEKQSLILALHQEKDNAFDKTGSSKSKSEVTGYSVQAKDMDEVKAIVADHIHI